MAAFPLDQVEERRAVTADLYGPLAGLDRDIAVLERLGRPVYVLYRSADFPPAASPADGLGRRSDRFTRVYDRDGFVVYRLASGSTATAGARKP
jgi:hypothetical protein